MNKKMFRKTGHLLLISFFVSSMSTSCINGSSTAKYTSGTGSSSSDSSNSNGSGDNSDTAEDSGDYTPDTSDVTYIALNTTSITVTGSGASVDSTATVVTITAAGTYSISGRLNDGQIIVNTADADNVNLIFNGINITCSDSAPVYVQNAVKTVIDLADGTTNTVTDSSAARSNTDINAAIFSNDYISFYSDGSGTGSLTVNGNYKDGIGTDDGLLIAGGTITVNSAVDDGIRGKDYLVIKSGTVTVNSTGDGLRSSNEDDSTKGYILIEGGTVTVTATAGDAITAVTDVQIKGGTFTVKSGGGSSVVPVESTSSKGIKGLVSVTVDGGTFSVDSSDDAMHSNGSITINSGSLNLSSNNTNTNSTTGQDGIHAVTSVTINGGTVTVAKSYEGVESKTITINAGTVNISASDDCFNATAGSATEYDDGSCLYIKGGSVYASAATGDGLDSNGSIAISGGLVVVQGPSSQPEVALDYNGTFTLTGGVFIASGPNSGNMIQPQSSISSTSTQYCLKVTGKSSSLLSSKFFHIQDASGNDIVTYKPLRSAYYFLVSSPAFVKGSTYYISTGGSYDTGTDGTSVNGYYSGGTYTVSGSSTAFTPSTSLVVTAPVSY